MLILVAMMASASALDVWAGSNNAVASGTGSVLGLQGIQFNDAGNVLQVGLEANALVNPGGIGIAVSDWSIPLATIQRTKVMVRTHTVLLVCLVDMSKPE